MFSDNNISQGSVATPLRCGGICNDLFIANFRLSVTVKEFTAVDFLQLCRGCRELCRILLLGCMLAAEGDRSLALMVISSSSRGCRMKAGG